MSLRQVTPEPFPYKDFFSINTVKQFDSRSFEFTRAAFLHGLSIYCSVQFNMIVRVIYPTTFTNGGESSNFVEIFAGIVDTVGLFLAPGTLSTAPVEPISSWAPLPAAFPQGAILDVYASRMEENGDVEIFLIAST